jgi:hypothetical protein
LVIAAIWIGGLVFGWLVRTIGGREGGLLGDREKNIEDKTTWKKQL